MMVRETKTATKMFTAIHPAVSISATSTAIFNLFDVFVQYNFKYLVSPSTIKRVE
jgi:hypothetical protein